MDKWCEGRVNAYKRFVENEEKKAEKLEREYVEQQRTMRSTIERIQEANRRSGEHRAELWLQGWMMEGGEWVKVDDSKTNIHERERR